LGGLSEFDIASFRVSHGVPRIGMAGLVSPASSWKQELLSTVSNGLDPRPDRVTKFVMLPVGHGNLGPALQQYQLFRLCPFLKPERMKAMQLKHLNLTTSDVSGLAVFIERFLGFKRVLERGSGAFTILRNSDDFVLTLMKAKRQDPASYPETFHVGFYLDNPDAVHAKRDELAIAGQSPGDIQREGDKRGTHFYCTAPGNVVVEIATPPSL
jgi:catechol 2,3-dioxygenase-like lactoylglutathione lyase family enzyme